MNKKAATEINWWTLAMALAILALLLFVIAVVTPAGKNLMASLNLW